MRFTGIAAFRCMWCNKLEHKERVRAQEKKACVKAGVHMWPFGPSVEAPWSFQIVIYKKTKKKTKQLPTFHILYPKDGGWFILTVKENSKELEKVRSGLKTSGGSCGGSVGGVGSVRAVFMCVTWGWLRFTGPSTPSCVQSCTSTEDLVEFCTCI